MGVEAGLHERLDSAPSCAGRDKRASNQRREHIDERALIHSVVSFLKFNVEARLAADSRMVTGYPEQDQLQQTDTLQNGERANNDGAHSARVANGTGEQQPEGTLGAAPPAPLCPRASWTREDSPRHNSHPSHPYPQPTHDRDSESASQRTLSTRRRDPDPR